MNKTQKPEHRSKRYGKTVPFRAMGILMLVLSISITSVGCMQEEPLREEIKQQMNEQSGFKQISQDEAKSMMDHEDDLIIVDVRTEEEYAQGHIEYAICIPNESIGEAGALSESVMTKLPNLHQTILIYCRSGNRSKQAARKLSNAGYSNIYEFGGITTWPYEIVK